MRGKTILITGATAGIGEVGAPGRLDLELDGEEKAGRVRLPIVGPRGKELDRVDGAGPGSAAAPPDRCAV